MSIVTRLQKYAREEKADELGSLAAEVLHDNDLKVQLWKGSFNGESIGNYFNSIMSTATPAVQVSLLNIMRVIVCKSEKKNKELLFTALSSFNIKAPKWYTKFIDCTDFSKLLYDMFVKKACQLENGYMFMIEDELQFLECQSPTIRANQIKMYDVDDKQLTLFLDNDIALITMKNTANVSKFTKWLQNFKIIETSVKQVSCSDNDIIKEAINKKEEPHVYKTPKKMVNRLEGKTLTPKKFIKDEPTLIKDSESSVPCSSSPYKLVPESKITKKRKAPVLLSVKKKRLSSRLNKPVQKPVKPKLVAKITAKPVKSKLIKPTKPLKTVVSSEDYDLGNIALRPHKYASKLRSSSSLVSSQLPTPTITPVFSNWQSELLHKSNMFFSNKQTEIQHVIEFIDQKKLLIQNNIDSYFQPKDPSKLYDIVAGESINKQRRGNLVKLKNSVVLLMNTWSKY